MSKPIQITQYRYKVTLSKTKYWYCQVPFQTHENMMEESNIKQTLHKTEYNRMI